MPAVKKYQGRVESIFDLEVRLSSTGERGVYTTQRIEAAREVFRITYFPLRIVDQYSGFCDYCLVEVGPQPVRCQRCQRITYCNTGCRAAARNDHELECITLGNSREPRAWRLLCRFLSKHSTGRLNSVFAADLKDLGFHEAHLQSRPWWPELQRKLEDLRGKARTSFSTSQLVALYCQFTENYNQPISSQGKLFGDVLEPFLGFFNHSCDPNVHWYYDGKNLRCTALKDIPEATELTTSYLWTSLNYQLRQYMLEKRWAFRCKCVRCVREEANPAFRMNLIVENLQAKYFTVPYSAMTVGQLEANLREIRRAIGISTEMTWRVRIEPELQLFYTLVRQHSFHRNVQKALHYSFKIDAMSYSHGFLGVQAVLNRSMLVKLLGRTEDLKRSDSPQVYDLLVAPNDIHRVYCAHLGRLMESARNLWGAGSSERAKIEEVVENMTPEWRDWVDVGISWLGRSPEGLQIAPEFEQNERRLRLWAERGVGDPSIA